MGNLKVKTSAGRYRSSWDYNIRMKRMRNLSFLTIHKFRIVRLQALNSHTGGISDYGLMLMRQ
jgi:hypothetical protein